MWEVIRANQRRSFVLIVVLLCLLIAMGYAIGFAFAPDEPAIPAFFVLVAVVIWLVMMLTSLFGGEKVLLSAAKARPIEKKDAPQLFNIVEEMTIAAGLPVMPQIYIIDNPEPNAFAAGIKPERAVVAVTTGLLGRLNRDELQGVIAHEIAHINNRDILFMTLAGVTVGAVIILSEVAWRSLRFGRISRGGSSSKGGGQAALVIAVVAIVLAILAPLLAQLLYFACSRKREYLADASAAQFTRYPEGLASALDKISRSAGSKHAKAQTSRALAPMYIVNPMAARSKRAGWFSTHPPTEDRIRILRGMTSASSLAAYEQAYEALHKGDKLVGAASLKQAGDQGIREPSKDEPKDGKKQWRQVQDTLHQIQQYALIPCVCGLRIKIPPDFDQKTMTCPKCGTKHPVPAELFQVAAAMKATQL